MSKIKHFHNPCENCQGIKTMYVYPGGSMQIHLPDSCKNKDECEKEMQKLIEEGGSE